MKSERLEEVTRELENPTIWDNPQRAQDLGKERANLDRIVGGIRSLTDALGEAGDLLDLAIGENDEGTIAAVSHSTNSPSSNRTCPAASFVSILATLGWSTAVTRPPSGVDSIPARIEVPM